MKCYLEITGNISKMLSPFASSLGLPRWCRDKESTCWCKRCRFDTWIFRKILWSKKWQWLQYSCLGDPMDKDGGPRGNPMVGYSPRGCKESEMTKQLSTHTHTHKWTITTQYTGPPVIFTVALWRSVHFSFHCPRATGHGGFKAIWGSLDRLLTRICRGGGFSVLFSEQ